MNLSHFCKFNLNYLFKLTIYFLTLFFTTFLSTSEAFNGGLVTSKVYLNLTSSPFIISENVLIEKGASLLIEAGVELRFYSKKGITVHGSLIAKGTEDQKIVLTRLHSPSKDYVSSSLNPSVISSSVQWPNLRLVDGNTPFEGRLQIWFKNNWHSICSNFKNWTQADLNVACKELGFSGGSWHRWYDRHSDSKQFMFESPDCNGQESSIRYCKNWANKRVGSGICDYHADLGIKCSPAFHPIPEYWAGIRFLNADYESVFVKEFDERLRRKISKSLLENVAITFAGVDIGGASVPALLSIGVAPEMKRLEIKYSAFTGLNLTNPSDRIFIEDSNFSENRGNGIFVNTSYNSINLKRIRVKNNGADGIRFINHDEMISAPSFCEFTNLGAYQIYPVYLTNHQSKNFYRNCCQEFSLPVNSKAKLIAHFPYLMSEDDVGGFVTISDEYSVSHVIKFPIRNNTRPSSFTSVSTKMKICYNTASFNKVFFNIIVTADRDRAYDLNIIDSEIRKNNGRGVWVEGQKAGTILNRTQVLESSYIAGLHLSSGTGDIIVSSSIINNNDGDGINISLLGGYKHIDRTIIRNNKLRGIAFWFNQTSEYHSFINLNYISYSTIEDNAGIGLLISNSCLSNSFWNISMNKFIDNWGDSLFYQSCLDPDSLAKATLFITHNQFIKGKRIAINISPALHLNSSLIEHNFFESNQKGAIYINNFDFLSNDFRFDNVEVNLFINDNYFSKNLGTFVVNLGLNEFSPKQKIYFFKNILKDNIINQPYPNLNPRSRIAAVVVIASTNCLINQNNFINPLSKYELGSHLEIHFKIINASFNFFGNLNTRSIYQRIFDRKNRYNLALIEFLRYRTREHFFEISEFLSSNNGKENEKYNSFLNGNVIGGELFANEFNLPIGTYHVKEDIFVRPGSKLILNKGTVLKFDKSIGMMVQGSLEFINTAQDLIVFTSLNLPSNSPFSIINKQSRTMSNFSSNSTRAYVSKISQISKRSTLPITQVSLSKGTEGRIEVVIDGVRGSVCSYGFDIVDASVVCQQLGMALNSRDWLLEKSELKNNQPLEVLLSNVKCAKFDYELASCEAETKDKFENSCPSEVGIRCYPTSWSGIRFGVNAAPTDIQHVRIEKAGLYDYSLNKFKPALQIDFNRHRLFNVKIYDNSGTGVGIMWNDVFNTQYQREIFSSDIHSNSFNGITSHSQGLKVVSCNLHKNKGSGFHYEPMITQEKLLDLTSWITPSKFNSITLLPNFLSKNNTIYLKPGFEHNQWYLVFEKNISPKTEFSFTVETDPTYAIGIMVLNPIPEQFTDNLVMFQKNRPELPKINLKRNFSSFPIWKYSYKLSFTYFGGSKPKGGTILYLSIKKIECETISIAEQEKETNQIIKTTVLENNIMKENKQGFSSNHYSQSISLNGNCYYRHENETFIFQNNHFEKNFGESLFVNSPIYEPFEGALAKINYTLINNRFLNNTKCITQINRDVSNSNNLFHWTINGLRIENNQGGGISIKLPYVWQFNENFTHSVSIHNNSFYNNRNFEFLIDGHFSTLTMSKNDFLANQCKYALITFSGVEKKMSITDNYLERNYCNFVVEFNLQSHADKFGTVEANFQRNQIIENKPLIKKRALDQYNPSSYTIAIRGVQYINVTRNLFRNPDLQYELLAGVLTGSLGNKINVAQNWWNTINTTIIQQRIFDFDDWNCYAIAQFSPILFTESIHSKYIQTNLKEETFDLNKPFGGRLYHSLTLKKRPKPYIINTDLTIQPEATLTIEPGVTLELYPSVGILVLGDLIAVGKPNDIITMRIANIDEKEAAPYFSKSKRNNYQEAIRICKTESCDEWYQKKTHDGFLEIYNKTTLQWVPLCDKRFSEKNAQVVCHQLGFSRLNAHVKKGRRLDLSQTRISRIGDWPESLICTGKEEKLEECESDFNINTNTTQICSHQSEDFVYLFCGSEFEGDMMYWGGIRFTISGFERKSSADFSLASRTYFSPYSRLQHVHISRAGILHGEKHAAIQIVQRDANIESVKVSQSAYHGIESIAPYRHLIFNKLDIRNNLGLGLNYLILDGASTDEASLPFKPLKESTLPYNVFSMVDICDINKTLIVEQRILLYYKYDNKAVDCVKIMKSSLRFKKIGFRFLQFNLFNSKNFSSQPDFIKIYDGDIFNSTVKMMAELGATENDQIEKDKFSYYKSSQETLSVRLHATGASGVYGFIAEVITSPVSFFISRGLFHNLTQSQIIKNTLGAIVYKTAGETSPSLSIQQNNIISNCISIYGNFTTCSLSAHFELQNTPHFFFRNNLIEDNEGGVNLKASAQSAASSLHGFISNNLFVKNHKGGALKINGPNTGSYQIIDIRQNYFTKNFSPYRANIVLSKVICNFTENTIVRNLGLHQVEVIGYDTFYSYQLIQNNWIYNNVASNSKQKSTIYANNVGQLYYHNYFANPENNFEISTKNVSKLDLTSEKSQIEATYNWWGFNDSGAISSRIFDEIDNSQLISIKFIPFLESNSSLLSGICSGGWKKIGKTCFFYFGARMSYFEAKDFCESQNSTMPIVKVNVQEILHYFYQVQENFNFHTDPVWIQSFSFLEHECTVLLEGKVKRFACEKNLPFLCERDPDISVVIPQWYREPLGLAALAISTFTAILTCLFIVCWTCKSRERHKEKLERRNSIRASIRSNRSLASSGSLNEIVYKRQIEKAINLAKQNQQTPVASSPNIISNNNFKKKNDSFESLEKDNSHFNESSDVEDLDMQNYTAASRRKVYRELEDRFAKDPKLENANVALMLRPTFDLTYQNEGFKETSSISRGSTDFSKDFVYDPDTSPTTPRSTLGRKRIQDSSTTSLPFRSISPHHHHYEEYSKKSPTPPTLPLHKSQYNDLYNFKSRSQLSINGQASDTTGLSEHRYLETSLDGDNNYDYFDCHSNRYSPTTSVTTASTNRSRPTLETAM